MASVTPDTVCSVDSCESAKYVKGMCNKHYRRTLRNGTVELSRKAPDTSTLCSVENCSRPYLASGYCNLHYIRIKTTRQHELKEKVKRICSVEGCGRPHAAKNLCGKHYSNHLNSIYTEDKNKATVCTSCRKDQSQVNFFGYRKLCTSCHYNRYKKQARDSKLKKTYGISSDMYAEMLEKQGYRCAICFSTDPGGRGVYFHVDHNHTTGVVRNLLCSGCNLAIGHMKDSPDIARKIARYLEDHSDK